MTNKKQRAELEAALGSWLFDGIANEWTTTEILSAVANDWQKAVGTYTPASLRDLTSWQGTVLGLVGVGTGAELADKQREADAALLLWSSADMPEHSAVGALIRELADEILQGTAKRRGESGIAVQEAIFESVPSTVTVSIPGTLGAGVVQ